MYRARREEDSTPVILKVLRNEYPSPRDLAALRAEFGLSRELIEGGVSRMVEPLALVPHENSLVMVLADVSGVTLADHVEYRRLGTAEFLAIAAQVAEALQEVHSQGVVHKDVKPQNLVINQADGRVRLTDFGISSRLATEDLQLVSPTHVEGTLAYMAPEQTGRMNRSVDHRSDLYALGVTLFELLTGKRPFEADDLMRLVYCHIAQPPPRADDLSPGVPKQLAAIVERLLSKAASDRYQSARGVRFDLQRCQQLLAETGAIAEFPLGQGDVSDRFTLPQKLYGRDAEVAELLAAFDAAASGGRRVLFVSGYSGVGKSRLINEVKRPITRRDGYFIGGKIDQHQRGQPYSALIGALRELTRQVLTEPPDSVARWRDEMLEVLGPNGAILPGLVPDPEGIIGEQPPVQELAAAESQNRFNEVVVDFVRGLASARHPLALFLDDLQWAEPASLALLLHLVTDTAVHHLFVIAAYRDNEVQSDHPLALTMDEIDAAGAEVERIHLEGLSIEALAELIADALHREADYTRQLAEFVGGKTGGNPFFVGQFLQALYRKGLLRLGDDGQWAWDVSEISGQELTDNVVELMTERIAELSEETSRALQFGACVGARFHLRRLVELLEGEPVAVAGALFEAVTQGLLSPLDDSYRLLQGLEEGDEAARQFDPGYRFAHDRIQQAAHDLLDDSARGEVHLRLGRLLLEAHAPEELGDRLFEAADHVNASSALLADDAERLRAARTNLVAGRTAKLSAAFLPALGYLEAGRTHLGAQLWADPEGLSFPLVSELAEDLDLAGQSDWRLPNAKELHSIVDYTRAPDITGSAAIDPVFDVSDIEAYFWASTTHVDGPEDHQGTFAVYIAFGEAMGWMESTPNSGNYSLMDVHGAGAQRSDPKVGDLDDYPNGHGPQGDVVLIDNYARCVRGG